MTTPVICRPDVYLRRRVLSCPTCKRRRRFAWSEAAWYGATVTCCSCGDSWTNGERHERPFRRGWRKEAAAQARRIWEVAPPFDRAEHSRWLRAQFGDEPDHAGPAGR